MPLWFSVRINTAKSRFKLEKWRVNTRTNIIYDYCVCPCVRQRHPNDAILSLLSAVSYHHQQQKLQQQNNSSSVLFIHSRKLNFQFQFWRKAQSCFVCLFCEPTIFMASFPVYHSRIRIICLFTLNPSSCIFGAWFKIGILVLIYAQISIYVLCNFPKRNSRSHNSWR